MPKPIIAIKTETEQQTKVANLVGLTIGVTAVVAVFIVIGAAILTAPAVPTIITALDDTTTVTLRWTAPGDDGATGQATAYDVRYSTAAITVANFSQATSVSAEPTPKVAGGIETKTISGLQPATTYYFALKTVDDNGNWSALSNVASHTTGCNPDWTCTAWSTCVNGTQTRTCIDDNVCGDLATRPAVNRSCTAGGDVGGCSPVWRCSQWSSCYDGRYYRNCIDANLCGTSVSQPIESVSCAKSICRELWSCGQWSTCRDGRRTRTCQDANRCGTTDYKPTTEIGCRSVPPPSPQETTVTIAGRAAGSTPQVRAFRRNQTIRSSFYAYDRRFRGGVTVAAGDVDGDGKIEIVTGTGPGNAPHVRIFSLDGRLEGQFFAFASFLRTGVDVAVGDVNGDGREDIVTAPLTNGWPLVRVYTKVSTRYRPLGEVFAYASHFRGGVSVAADDLNGDQRAEIVTVPFSRRAAQVRVFKYQSGAFKQTSQFYAFNKKITTGFDVAVVHSDGPYNPRIAVVPSAGGEPRVRLYRPNGRVTRQFYVANAAWRGGVVLSSADLDRDGWDEIITGAYSGGRPGVYVFRYHFGARQWRRTDAFYAFDRAFIGGIRVFSPR